MNVSKDKIVKGLLNYIRTDVYSLVTDNHFKFILSAVTAALEVNPSLSDVFFSNPLIKAAFSESDGQYDINVAEKILTKAVNDAGSISISVPAIPLIMPGTQEMIFKSQDIANLFMRIREV